MTNNPRKAFLDAIWANPDDDAPRLIYADWLDDNGDGPRAEFIRLQCKFCQDSLTPREICAIQLRCQKLLATHRLNWLIEDVGKKFDPDAYSSFLFQRGFVAGLMLEDPRDMTLGNEDPYQDYGPITEKIRGPLVVILEKPRPLRIASYCTQQWFHRVRSLQVNNSPWDPPKLYPWINNLPPQIVDLEIFLTSEGVGALAQSHTFPQLKTIRLYNSRLLGNDARLLGERHRPHQRLFLRLQDLSLHGVQELWRTKFRRRKCPITQHWSTLRSQDAGKIKRRLKESLAEANIFLKDS